MKKFFVFCITALMALLVFAGCGASKNSWIISINGTKIEKAEFMVYLYEQVKVFEETGGSDIWAVDFDGVPAPEVAKQNAANSLLRAKLAVNAASSVNVDTNVDEATVESEGQALYESIMADDLKRIPLDDITPELCKNIIRDGLILQRVYDKVTSTYEANRQDFENYLQDYYNTNIAYYKNITVKAIYVSADPNAAPLDGEEPAIDEFSDRPKKEITLKGRERIDEAYSLLESGKEFGEVQYNYSEDPNRREFTMNSDMYDDDLRFAIYSLNEGEYTDVLEYNGGYYIFYAKSVSQTSIEDIRNEVQAEYDAAKKEEIYQEQNDKWMAAAEIKRNSNVWESVVIKAETADELTDTDMTELAATTQ